VTEVSLIVYLPEEEISGIETGKRGNQKVDWERFDLYDR
jgi:hypothetical protein